MRNMDSPLKILAAHCGLIGASLAIVTVGWTATSRAVVQVEGPVTATEDASRFRIGDLALESPQEKALERYGPPARTEDDIFGVAHTWELGPGAEISAGVWEEDGLVYGVAAEVPPDGSTTLETHGGIELGRSPLRNVIAVWGPGHTSTHSPESDYVVAYDLCLDGAPVVVKFDQPADVRRDAAAGLALDEPVTRLLIAYADEDAALTSCTAGE